MSMFKKWFGGGSSSGGGGGSGSSSNTSTSSSTKKNANKNSPSDKKVGYPRVATINLGDNFSQ
jgi:hypothetical protein